ncbi:hypothetical protein [Mesorhizobium sp. ES1-6]|uniref:hypothetical protein n=1 Tax=Mesorhizobium sp. ES1-6 TaxID=2876626 RepID=UPI001CCB7106|nr:hypothetical protein [Mesorhizobium sp. ES1-6]MBZ9803379.1 hypothetical protein [Mesorhizobium sp. ES1-6]
MLLERASGLAEKISQYQKLKGTADEAQQFHTRADQFGTVAERIANTRRALERLASAGVAISFVPSDGMGLAAKAKTLRAAIRDNPAAVKDPPFDLRYDFTDRITGIAAAAEKSMTDAWKAYVAKRADFGPNDVLSALAEVPQFRPSVDKILHCRTNITALGNSLPTDPQATVVRLDTLIAEHDTAWATISAEDIPRSVISFIRAAASDGAPLTAYTDEVQTWLESRHLINSFRIRLR